MYENFGIDGKAIVELIDESYIRFLGSAPKDDFKRLRYSMWPNYVSGKCFFSS